MKKGLIYLAIFAILLIVPSVLAINLQVDKKDLGSVVISEISNPAKFRFTITNLGASDNAEIYSYAPVSIGPKGAFSVPSGKSDLDVFVYPSKEVRKTTGYYNFGYEIKGSDMTAFKDTLTIKIVDLADAIEVIPGNILPGDKYINITVKSVENTNLDDVRLEFSSLFFDQSETISLGPYEQTSFLIPVNQDNIKSLRAGAYVVTTSVALGDAKTKIESSMNYLEKEGLAVKEESQGFLLRSKTITKTNEGNVPVKAKIEVSKDIITRLFTISSLEASSTERSGFSVNYMWERELKPAESFSVTTTTNYTFPFILVIVVILAAIMAKLYYQTSVTLKKRVSFVRTKGGEFAVKVTLHVSSKKSVNDVQIIDRLPGSTQLYEKFGTKPDKIDAATKRLIWNIPRLNSGEERVFSYIIYSKLKIVGRFELPPATAIYNKEDKTHESFSNRTFFMSETAGRAED